MQTETYLLACTRYIELNPVRARRVAAAGEYLWSSHGYRQRMGETACWIDLYPAHLDLADEETERVTVTLASWSKAWRRRSCR